MKQIEVISKEGTKTQVNSKEIELKYIKRKPKHRVGHL
jgi:hypothetical protein